MISVVLTKEQHAVFTKRWSTKVPYGVDYTIFKSWDDLRWIAEEVYYDAPEFFAILDAYMNSLS